MNIDIKVLEAKRDEYKAAIAQHQAAIEQHQADQHANFGALQTVEELIAVAKAPEPAASKDAKSGK